MIKVGIIGGGNMGAAIIARIRKNYALGVCEADASRAAQLKKKFRVKTQDLAQLAAGAKVIILAVKPQDFDAVLQQLRPVIKPAQLVISIAAGITTLYIEKRLPGRIRVVRTMPNMPAMIGEGITALAAGQQATSADMRLAAKILGYVGRTVVVKEDLLDAVTAVSGSGPAYVFLFAECLLQAARSLGMDEKLSHTLVAETLLGSVHLLTQSKESAADLRARVTSKGGTTQAAMDVFLGRKLNDVFIEALTAAKNRAKELSK